MAVLTETESVGIKGPGLYQANGRVVSGQWQGCIRPVAVADIEAVDLCDGGSMQRMAAWHDPNVLVDRGHVSVGDPVKHRASAVYI